MEYYLYGTGGTVLDILNSTMGLDVTAGLDQANTTLTDLQASSGERGCCDAYSVRCGTPEHVHADQLRQAAGCKPAAAHVCARARVSPPTMQAAVAADPALDSALGADIVALLVLFADVTASVDSLVLALSYASFHPVGRGGGRESLWGWVGCCLQSIEAGIAWVPVPSLQGSCPVLKPRPCGPGARCGRL